MLCGQQVPYSETWPASGMTQGGRLYPLPMPVLRIAGSESSSSPGLLPTPRTAHGMNSTMEANRERIAHHQAAGGRAWRGTIEEAVSLLPTPNATDHKGPGQPPGRTRDGHLRPASDADLPTAVELLKTPTAQLAVNGGSQDPEKRKAGGHGPTLADQVEHSLLPTPRATDGTKGGPNQRGSSGDMMLPSAVQMLLPTPTANVSGRTGEQHMAMRHAIGRNTPSQLEAAAQLLPTPSAALATGGQASRSGDRIDEPLLPAIAKALAASLLPTPAARDWKSGHSNVMDRNSRPLNEVVQNSLLATPRAADGGPRGSSAGWGLRNQSRQISSGEPTSQPSAAGKPYSDGPLQGQLSLDEPESA